MPPLRGPLIALMLLLTSAAGCFTAEPAPVQVLSFSEEKPVLTMRLPIHIVAVGFEAFDDAKLLEKVQRPNEIYAGIRLDVTGLYEREPLQYDVQYSVTVANESFAKALFDHMATVSEKVYPDSFLQSYDRNGEQRVCAKGPLAPLAAAPVPLPQPTALNPTCGEIDRIDAHAVEAWIAENRAQYGLVFPAPSQTIFVLDSYTKAWLPQDTYHQYTIADPGDFSYTKNLRAWGGTHDFVFLDVGAGPNSRDIRPWGNFSREEFSLFDERDPPIWDLKDDMGTFYENLGRNVYDATRMLWTRTPIYPYEYADKYVLPLYVYIDAAAHANPASPFSKVSSIDYEAMTKLDVISKAFRDLTPWAEVTYDIKFVYLDKGDDPGMAKAVEDGKSRIPGMMDFGPVKSYVRANWDAYVPEVDGARSYPTFAFVLDVASTQTIYAYSDADELGNSFGVFVNMADALLCPTRVKAPPVLCFSEDVFGTKQGLEAWWNAVLIHELGHSFGLMHPHDQFGIDGHGFSTYELNWLWDSTSSPMTYRHTLTSFNAFDRELILRGHAIRLAQEVLRAGDAAPAEATAAATRAVAAVEAGDYAGAMEAAREAKRLGATEPLALLAGVPGETVVTRLAFRAADPQNVLPLPLYVPAGGMMSFATTPLDIPEGTKALHLEYREIEAPTHRGWYAVAGVLDKEGTLVAFMPNNAHDMVVMLDLTRCAKGCDAFVYAIAGVNSAYDLHVTPYA